MGRHRTFDSDEALDSAINIFSVHGFEGTSVDVLMDAMQMCRRSLYSEFGDKWQLYLAALQKDTAQKEHDLLEALRSPPSPLAGIAALFDIVINEMAVPSLPCLFLGAVSEFGMTQPAITELTRSANEKLSAAISDRLIEAQVLGEAASDLKPEEAAAFIIWTLGTLQMSARAGTPPATLHAMARLTQRSLR